MHHNNQIIVIFGYPGVGKTYVGNVLKEKFGFYFYDGDTNLSIGMKQAIKTKTQFSKLMRLLFFQRLHKSVGLLIRKHPKLGVTQTFIKEEYRTKFLKEFPQARFILITADNIIREKRLKKRSELSLDISYARYMVEHFETPQISHFELSNNTDGHMEIVKQLQKIGFTK